MEPEQGGARPTGVQGGVDLEVALDARDRWAILASAGGTAFFSEDPGQVTLSAGGQWKAAPALSLSLVVLRGFLDGADRWALLSGMTANVDVF